MSIPGFVGIDPGLNGYCAVVEFPRGERAPRLAFFPAPVLPTGRGERRIYDLESMSRLAGDWAHDQVELVLIEKQQAFPKQGAVSNFSTGYGYGAWKAMLTAHRLPFEEIRPDAWKRALGIAGGAREGAKARSIQRAQQLVPGVDLRALERAPKAVVACPDKAEALLLAIYASRLRVSRLGRRRSSSA